MEKIKKFTLYVGLNDKDTKKQEIADEAALMLIKGEVARRFGGGTIYKASGIYTHDSGEVVDENTYRIELLFAADNDVKDFVTMLKTALNQESIAVQVELINSELW